MDTPFRTYTQQVTSHLRHVTPQEKAALQEELEAHLEDHTEAPASFCAIVFCLTIPGTEVFSWNIINRWSTHLCGFFPCSGTRTDMAMK